MRKRLNGMLRMIIFLALITTTAEIPATGLLYAAIRESPAAGPHCSAGPEIKAAQYDLSQYRAQPGLTALVDGNTLVLTWDGNPENQGTPGIEFRMRLGIEQGVPTILELGYRNPKGEAANGKTEVAGELEQWQVLVSNVTPEFRIVSGIRRVTQQQTAPLEELGITLTEDILDSIKWDAFWDAPLYTEDKLPPTHRSAIPAPEPFLNHPGMPRKPEEVIRANAEFHSTECSVRTNGSRIEVIFNGVKAGIFEGYLQMDIFRGTGMIRQMLVAKTDHPSAAFKYDAGWKGLPVGPSPHTGLSGLPVGPSTRAVWKDLAGHLQEYRFGGPVQEVPAIVKSSNRLIAAETAGGSVAFFPPPHSFYWARETEQNLGYSWYRKDSPVTFAMGIRQAETEKDPEFLHNFALYSARPGTWQRMPVFICLNPGTARDAQEQALAFTRGDRFKRLPGYRVMGHHYHVELVRRLSEAGGFGSTINDVETMRAAGVDIFSIIDGVRGPARHDRGEAYLDALDEYYRAARSVSDQDFLVLANDENSTGGRPPFLGGHYDLLYSKPVYWRPQRDEGQPVIGEHPKYGTVYNLGSPMDLMQMTEHAGALVSLPHPATKGSTGYPEAIRDTPHFLHENYFSLGYRWGMGIDASEKRLGEYRFLSLWDSVNNWMAVRGLQPKYTLAISEIRSDYSHLGRPPYDDAYGMSPVNYLKMDRTPTHEDYSSVNDALKRGDYFVTSGEVLIPSWSIEGAGDRRIAVLEVEWTFPLEFIEVVWGDGITTGREIISTTGLPAFGSKRFEIPFDARGKKWVRVAAWDVATNGAMVQPVLLEAPGMTGSSGSDWKQRE
jgi:hypothetical protein